MVLLPIKDWTRQNKIQKEKKKLDLLPPRRVSQWYPCSPGRHQESGTLIHLDPTVPRKRPLDGQLWKLGKIFSLTIHDAKWYLFYLKSESILREKKKGGHAIWSLKYLWTIYIFVNVIKRMSKWFHQFSIIPTNGVDQYSWRAWNGSPRSLMMAHKSPLFIIGIWVRWIFFRFNRIHQFTVLGTLRGSFCSTFFCTQGKFGLKGWRDHHCKWGGGLSVTMAIDIVK